MRRLAKNSRKDTYLSNRDYQTLRDSSTMRITFKNPGANEISFSVRTLPFCEGLYGFGGYIKPNKDCNLTIAIQSGFNTREKSFNLVSDWNRIGLSWEEIEEVTDIHIKMFFNDIFEFHSWGLTCALLQLPETILQSEEKTDNLLQVINQPHLAPETFYLAHSVDSNLLLDPNTSKTITLCSSSSEIIILKKCSYCQRLLPVNHIVTLSGFHHHAAKKTSYQNECRSCKKWRINDNFNPDRTKDQLHESSVITRERKILLRENEKLQLIKNRHNGDGLKTLTWKKFGKKCFNCSAPLSLIDVRLDHTRPLAYLWPLDEYATSLCENCNNRKHDLFPVDFYSEEQLVELSKITGLNYNALIRKEINEIELQRMIDSIDKFAKKLDPRTFNSIARKVLELKPDIDLFAILKKKNLLVYSKLIDLLRERPE